MEKNTSQRPWGGWDWFGLVVISAVVLFIVFPFRGYPRKDKQKEAETKQNLHAIQLAVERFAVDCEGEYPRYLIGGTSAEALGTPGTIPFTSDVLLREGYLTSYPKNPFMRHKKPRSLELQENLPSSITGNDPLRPGDPEGDMLGYRFGRDGDIMGQVLCDPRYEKWSFTDPLSGETEQRDTWAIIEYPFWDTWNGKKHEPEFLPGMFFYKTTGIVVANGKSDGSDEATKPITKRNEHKTSAGDQLCPTLPLSVKVDNYIMGAYGSIRTKGKDILGDEQFGDSFRRSEIPYAREVKEDDADDFIRHTGPNWTRSAYSTTNLGGCPFDHPDLASAGRKRISKLSMGNPNGIPDGIIIVLSTGEDMVSSR